MIDLLENQPRPAEKAEYDTMLSHVDWDLPGMEDFSDREKQTLALRQ